MYLYFSLSPTLNLHIGLTSPWWFVLHFSLIESFIFEWIRSELAFTVEVSRPVLWAYLRHATVFLETPLIWHREWFHILDIPVNFINDKLIRSQLACPIKYKFVTIYLTDFWQLLLLHFNSRSANRLTTWSNASTISLLLPSVGKSKLRFGSLDFWFSILKSKNK